MHAKYVTVKTDLLAFVNAIKCFHLSPFPIDKYWRLAKKCQNQENQDFENPDRDGWSKSGKARLNGESWHVWSLLN